MHLLICLLPLLAASTAVEPTRPAAGNVTGDTAEAGPSPITYSAPDARSDAPRMLAQNTPAATGAVSAKTQAPASNDHWYSLSKGKKLGVSLDVNAPDGGGLLLLFRPWWWIRLNGGVAYNAIGTGIRGGVSLAPVHWAITPTLNLDAGHYYSGDLTKFVSTNDPNEKALLSHIAYDFASAQFGLELGSQQSFAFYLRGGLTYLSTTISGKDLTNYANSKLNAGNQFGGMADAKVTAVVPTIGLGFNIFFF